MKTQRVQPMAMVLALLLSVWTTSFAQGRPDTVWMRGGHIDYVFSVAFSPDGQYLVSGSWDRTIRFWRFSDGALLQAYDQETFGGVFSVQFSPNGRFFAYGRNDATVVLARWPDSDINGDGCVDEADLLAVLFAFGNTGDNLPEDINDDFVVDDADLLRVLFNFGNGC